MHEVLKID